jgi:hypothetical protein
MRPVVLKITLAFVSAGFAAGLAAAIYAFTTTGPPGDIADRLLTIFCPPSLGAMVIHARGEGVIIWAMIVVMNTLFYGVVGLLVGLVFAKLTPSVSASAR